MSVKVTSHIDDHRAEKIERAIALGMKAIGIHMEGAAVSLVPVKTGRLKGSITFATADHRSHPRGPAKLKDEVERPHRSRMVYVGTWVEYAPHVEYGTRHMPAQSFLRKALDEGRGDVRAILAMHINKVMIHG